jgi:hypothetical protein
MAALVRPCEKKHKTWGEVWWVGEKYEWVFFDGLRTSEIYGEQLTHCPACRRKPKRRNLKLVGRV